MKKILLSLSLIVFIGIVVAGATGAFFSDTETSTGNTFTAGAIDLKVDSEQHYNGNVCVADDGDGFIWEGDADYPVAGTECDGTWEGTDLGAQTFFNLTDVKPGDSGENTISLHVLNNDAWACVDVNLTKNNDNSSTEPELESGDVAENLSDDMDGELAQNVYFTAWGDDGDNIWEVNEPPLFSNISGPASDVLGGETYALADSVTNNGAVMTGDSTRYIGLAWCMGTQTVNQSGNTITCDGASMGNGTQTDSMEASIAFRVEQARNNDQFVCSRPE